MWGVRNIYPYTRARGYLRYGSPKYYIVYVNNPDDLQLESVPTASEQESHLVV